MRYITSILLYASLLLGEVHTLFENASTKPVNWILFREVPMSLQWNVKMVTDQLWFIFILVAMWFYRPNRINNTTVITFIGYAIIDFAMYFINYKTYEYGIVYTGLLIAWIIIYNLTYDRSRITFINPVNYHTGKRIGDGVRN